MDDTIQFQNMDSWRGSGSGKFGLTFKQIVLMHINRCVINGSVEWVGGYWQERSAGSYVAERVYIQNTREVYCNSVKMLRACLLGYFDDKIKKKDKELQEEFKIKSEEIEKADKENDNKEERKNIVSEWRQFKIDWHIRLFEELIMLSKRLNFFEEETAEEDI